MRREASGDAPVAAALPLVDALPVVVYQVEPEPPYAPLYVSAGASALGCPREEWLATPDLWMRMLHPDDRARVLDATERAMRAGGTVDYEYRLIGRDGVVRWVHDRGAFVRDAAGRAVAWQGVMLDVSARHGAEAALRETEARRAEAVAELSGREARFRALIDHAQDVVGVLAPDGTILYESPAVERVLGFRPEELEGRPGLAFVHPDDVAAATAALAHRAGHPRRGGPRGLPLPACRRDVAHARGRGAQPSSTSPRSAAWSSTCATSRGATRSRRGSSTRPRTTRSPGSPTARAHPRPGGARPRPTGHAGVAEVPRGGALLDLDDFKATHGLARARGGATRPCAHGVARASRARATVLAHRRLGEGGGRRTSGRSIDERVTLREEVRGQSRCAWACVIA
jgi:PAS domain S-box-containing protein